MRLQSPSALEEYYKLEKIVAECEKSGVHTKFIPDYGNIIPTRPYTEDLLGLPVINIRYVPLSNTFNAFVKRLYGCGGIDCVYHPLFTGDAAVGNPCQGDIEGTADLCTGESGAAQ